MAFDIDANGILNVSATDKATGKEQSIVIKASSGLDEAEIERMVKDAEAHAEEDHKAAELVSSRNAADNMIHGVRKSMAELGDQVDEAEKSKVEEAIQELEKAMEGSDKEAIEAKSNQLMQASQGLLEKAHASQQAGAQAKSGPGGAEGDDSVVDADFEEVSDDKS